MVPLKDIYFTSGRTRTLNFNGYPVYLRKVEPYKIALGDSEEGHLIRCLASYRPTEIQYATRNLDRIKDRINWRRLLEKNKIFPGWLSSFIEEYVKCRQLF